MGGTEDFSNFINAVIDEKSFDNIAKYIDDAKASDDVEVIAGGNYDKSKGYFIEPTVLLAKDPKYTTMCEEIFGPVLSVLTFQDEDEAIRLANDSCFGLAAYVATTNLARSQRLGQRLSAGSIVVLSTSTPQSGGVAPGFESHKESGFGVESKLSGLASYTLTSTMFVMA